MRLLVYMVMILEQFLRFFRDHLIFPFIDNGRTRRPLTPIKYMDKSVSTIVITQKR